MTNMKKLKINFKNNLLLKNINKKKRIKGRGLGSDRGKHSGRGMNGQKSRGGYNMNNFFEGGQIVLFRRLKKRGFYKRKKKKIIFHTNLINKKLQKDEININNLSNIKKIKFPKLRNKKVIIKILRKQNNKTKLNKTFKINKDILISKFAKYEK